MDCAMLLNCAEQCQAFVVLATNTLKAEFPDTDVLNSFRVFDVCNGTKQFTAVSKSDQSSDWPRCCSWMPVYLPISSMKSNLWQCMKHPQDEQIHSKLGAPLCSESKHVVATATTSKRLVRCSALSQPMPRGTAWHRQVLNKIFLLSPKALSSSGDTCISVASVSVAFID